MQFIECAQSKLDEFSLTIDRFDVPIWHSVQQFGQFRHFLEMLAKKAFSFGSGTFCDFLRSNPTAYDIIQNIQSIRENEPDKSCMDLLIKWLIKSHADQKPKIPEIYITVVPEKIIFIDKIKEVGYFIFYLFELI